MLSALFFTVRETPRQRDWLHNSEMRRVETYLQKSHACVQHFETCQLRRVDEVQKGLSFFAACCILSLLETSYMLHSRDWAIRVQSLKFKQHSVYVVNSGK